MNNIIVFGYFGQNNAGDDWFLKYYLSHSSKKYSKISIYSSVSSFNCSDAIFFGFGNIEVIHKQELLRKLITASSRTTIIILGGDQLLHVMKSKALFATLLISRIRNLPTYCIGTSIDVKSRMQNYLQILLLKRRRLKIFPRDGRRNIHLKPNTCCQIVDLGVHYLRKNYPALISGAQCAFRNIDVFVSVHAEGDPSAFLRQVDRMSSERPLDIAIGIFSKQDIPQSRRLEFLLLERKHHVKSYCYLDDERAMLSALKAAKVVFNMRLHAILASIVFSKKTMLDYYYDEKCKHAVDMVGAW